jgi:RNA polymerase sigma-70 factor (ECF subfamily)
MNVTDDQELIDRTLRGDGEAYATLVGRYQRAVFRVAFAILRDENEADTVTQDTFVKAYTALSRFERRAAFESWLTRIAINRSRDALRRRDVASLFGFGSACDGSAIDPADDSPDPERQASSAQLREAITRAERSLSAQQKVVFRLRHYEDLAPDEIAAHLGLNPSTVRAHLFRAVHKVRRELAGWRDTRGMTHAPALQ